MFQIAGLVTGELATPDAEIVQVDRLLRL